MSFFSVDLMQSKRKCAVIGCLGTGGTIAWALAQSGLCDELVLIDDDKRTADGQVADILGALPYSASPDVWVGDYADLEGCSLIIMAVGIPALYESAQANQIELNLPLVRAAAAGIAANNSEAVVLVAGEPVDIMTHIALHSLGFPPSRVIGLGTLPLSLRTGKLIAQYLGTDSRNVQAMVLGTDDDNAFLCKTLLRVCGMSVPSYLKSMGRNDDISLLQSLLDDARYAQGRACDAKGRADFSVSHACVLIADAVLHDRGVLLPLCVCANGYCELSQICISLPCVLGKHGARVAYDVIPDVSEAEQLRRSAARLRAGLLGCELLFCAK